MPKWTEVSKINYLEAILKEWMRVLPVASWCLYRIVPPTGVTITDRFIPGGTVVGCQIDAVHQDEGVFGKNAHTFRPERWIKADEGQLRRMNRSFLAFSAGKRTCTGVHIAWLEMKKTLSMLLMHFNISLSDTDITDFTIPLYVAFADIIL